MENLDCIGSQLRRGACVENLGMSMGFYTSQITVGSFLYSVAVIGWMFKQSDTQHGNAKLLGEIGDCSYGIFYVHMAVLTLVGRFIQSSNWYSYWSLRFVLTSMLSFSIVGRIKGSQK